MHIVHLPDSNADGHYAAVLGFMFDVERGGSGENLFIDQIAKVFSSGAAKTTTS